MIIPIRTFTIAIPVRNGERYVAAAIESALRQTRPADEILVVDDASTDRTRAVATDGKWRERVRYEYNGNATGFADAFNRAAEMATSDFVVLLSADDVLAPGFLEAVEGALAAHPDVKFCYIAARYIDAAGMPLSASPIAMPAEPRRYDGKTYLHNYLAGFLNKAEIHRCAGTVVERRLLVEDCRFRKDAGIMADNDFFIRVAAKTDIVGIGQPLVSVRLHADAISARMESLNLRVAEDYLYQIRFLKAEPHLIAEPDMHIVLCLAARSLDGLLKESLLRARPDLHAAALRIGRDVQSLVGREAWSAAMIQTKGVLSIIGRHGWMGRLYGGAVFAAALAKPFKRTARRLLVARKPNTRPALLEP